MKDEMKTDEIREIRVCVSGEDELFRSFDPENDRLSNDLKEYIIKMLMHEGTRNDVIIHVISEAVSVYPPRRFPSTRIGRCTRSFSRPSPPHPPS